MKITVQGCAGEGKTTVALIIREVLKAYGAQVSYVEPDNQVLSEVGLDALTEKKIKVFNFKVLDVHITEVYGPSEPEAV